MSDNKTFTSTKGVIIALKPVSQFKIDSLRAAKEEIPAPTYTAKVAGGDSFEYPLDEEIARNKGRLDEWNEYKAKVARAEAEHAKKFLELLIWEGVDAETPGADSEWQKTSDYFGMKLPENPIERKFVYVYNELLGTPEDIGDLISSIMSVSKIDEEAVSKLRDSFRAGIQRKANKRVSEDEGLLEDQ
jgi:hypothetical protein